MTQAAEALPANRASETKLVAGVCFAHLVSHYYMLTLAPLFAFIRADFGVTYTELSLALTAFNVVSAVLQTPVGFFIDRTGARINLIGGLLLGSAAMAIAGAANSFWVLLAMFAVMGLANTVYHPADYALLSERVSPRRMTQVFSFHTCSGMIGSAIAPVTLLSMPDAVGWRGAFLCSALLGVAAALFLAVQGEAPVVRPAPSKPRSDEAASASADGWRLLLSPPILLNLAFFVVLSMVGGGLNQYLVVGLGALYGTPPGLANTALTGLLTMSAIGVLLGGVLAGRTARHSLVACTGLLVTGTASTLIAFVDPGALLLVRQCVRLRHHGLPYRRHGGALDLRAVPRPRISARGVPLRRRLRAGGYWHRYVWDVRPPHRVNGGRRTSETGTAGVAWKALRDVLNLLASRLARTSSELGDSSMVEQRTLTPLI